jgi:hypothetical protein
LTHEEWADQLSSKLPKDTLPKTKRTRNNQHIDHINLERNRRYRKISTTAAKEKDVLNVPSESTTPQVTKRKKRKAPNEDEELDGHHDHDFGEVLSQAITNSQQDANKRRRMAYMSDQERQEDRITPPTAPGYFHATGPRKSPTFAHGDHQTTSDETEDGDIRSSQARQIGLTGSLMPPPRQSLPAYRFVPNPRPSAELVSTPNSVYSLDPSPEITHAAPLNCGSGMTLGHTEMLAPLPIQASQSSVPSAWAYDNSFAPTPPQPTIRCVLRTPPMTLEADPTRLMLSGGVVDYHYTYDDVFGSADLEE